jgi:hypothetical protein
MKVYGKWIKSNLGKERGQKKEGQILNLAEKDERPIPLKVEKLKADRF